MLDDVRADMPSNDVKIDIEAKSCIDGEHTNSHTKAYGKCYFKNQKVYVSYSEKLEGVQEEIPSLITLDESYIQISRRGEVRSTMSFIQGEETKSTYFTTVGAIELDIYTTRYSPIITDDSITIYLDYSVKMKGTDGGVNSVIMTITGNYI